MSLSWNDYYWFTILGFDIGICETKENQHTTSRIEDILNHLILQFSIIVHISIPLSKSLLSISSFLQLQNMTRIILVEKKTWRWNWNFHAEVTSISNTCQHKFSSHGTWKKPAKHLGKNPPNFHHENWSILHG